MPGDAGARKTLLAAVAAILSGNPDGAALLLQPLDCRERDDLLAEAVVMAADLLSRLAGGAGVRTSPVEPDAELAVIGASLRSALVARHAR